MATHAIRPSLRSEEHIGDSVRWRHRATKHEEQSGLGRFADATAAQEPDSIGVHERLLLEVQQLRIHQERLERCCHPLLTLPGTAGQPFVPPEVAGKAPLLQQPA